MSATILVAGRQYAWEPTKSTPDWPHPVAELPKIVPEQRWNQST